MSSSKGEARGQPDVAAAERKARPFAKESSILPRKEVPHLRYTCKFLCMRKKKEKNSSSSSSRGYICRPSFDLMEIATDR